jgi:hypothetical protein
MLRHASIFTITAGLSLALGCDPSPVSDHAPVFRNSSDEAGLTSFLNDYEVSTEQVLDDACAIRSDSAKHIDKFRRGQDNDYGTDDDQLIDSEATLDSIHMVGPATIARLFECAEAFGYIVIDSCDQPGWTIEYVYGDESGQWPDTLPAGLQEVIADVLTVDDWCGGAYGEPWFVKATIDRLDCVEMGYTIELRQLVDEFHGLSWYIEFEVDTEFSYDGPVCEI